MKILLPVLVLIGLALVGCGSDASTVNAANMEPIPPSHDPRRDIGAPTTPESAPAAPSSTAPAGG